jgi:bisphosphoglycerate-dependent phosphoglycerate mutase
MENKTPEAVKAINKIVGFFSDNVAKGITSASDIVKKIAGHGKNITSFLSHLPEKIDQNIYSVLNDGLNLVNELFDGTIIRIIKEKMPIM